MFWGDTIQLTGEDYKEMVKILTFDINLMEFEKRKLLGYDQSAEIRKALAHLEKEITILRSARRKLVFEMADIM